MKTAINLLCRCVWRWDILLLCLSGILLNQLPQIDLSLESLFFDGEHFYLDRNPLVQLIYLVFAKAHLLVLLGLLGGLIYQWRRKEKGLHGRRMLCYLLLALIIGPGLMVNTVLKDHSFGRPRPVQIQQFGGKNHFAPAISYSGECQHNCSFVSGHASLGFYFMTIGWATQRRRWFLIGAGSGMAVGLARMMQGGHFFSDVLFSFWAVYFTSLLLAHLYHLTLRPHLPLPRPLSLPHWGSKVTGVQVRSTRRTS